MEGERLTYTVAEAAELLGVSTRSVYEAIQRGDLAHVMLGGRKLVPRKALLEFAEAGQRAVG